MGNVHRGLIDVTTSPLEGPWSPGCRGGTLGSQPASRAGVRVLWNIAELGTNTPKDNRYASHTQLPPLVAVWLPMQLDPPFMGEDT